MIIQRRYGVWTDTSSADNTVKYWNLDKGTLLATQVFFKDNTSAVYTPEGYFDYEGKFALDYISFTSQYMQTGFLALQDLMNDYYVDGLLVAGC